MFWIVGIGVWNWGNFDGILKWGCCWRLGLWIGVFFGICVFVIWLGVWCIIVNLGLVFRILFELVIILLVELSVIFWLVILVFCVCVLCWLCNFCVFLGDNLFFVFVEFLLDCLCLLILILFLFLFVFLFLVFSKEFKYEFYMDVYISCCNIMFLIKELIKVILVYR